ncbi:MAG: nucleotidyltransferase family protein [Prolixibacteraceae bacterium]|nr:nucleotidyltransferase family protein [Prolixibacteraceae bacterium]MBN2773441.1 nucleotidyltransferase family protein [Prolixibacteraceae bacterium]
MGREAIILAGGKGTRLRSLVNDRPKPMALINDKPFLFYLLNYLSKHNFTHIILAVGYKHNIIREYFGTNLREIKLSYSIEKEPLGTGGAILKALKKSENPNSFILNGDTYFPVSFDQMEKIANQQNSDLIIALRKLDNVSRYGTVLMDSSNRITGFSEKKGEETPGLINGGVYYLKNSSFLKTGFPEVFSFEKDYLEKFALSHNFNGAVFTNYFIDIGIPETFKQAQSDFFTFEV